MSTKPETRETEPQLVAVRPTVPDLTQTLIRLLTGIREYCTPGHREGRSYRHLRLLLEESMPRPGVPLEAGGAVA